jgi:hypothetical protein
MAKETVSASSSSTNFQKQFTVKAINFMKKTRQHALAGLNPGGYYTAIWSRDASYILRDWFLTGTIIDRTLQHIHLIWSHQITRFNEKIIYGRGSPEMKFLPVVADRDIQRKFEGALPTTIYHDDNDKNKNHNYSEVYAQNPDIDSTALMISTSSWIFGVLLREGVGQKLSSSTKSSPSVSTQNEKEKERKDIIGFVIPRMLKAIDYLESRDIDGDGLLEQNHNEDWMDTVLRAGKIVYSQACWILALNDFAYLLSRLGRDIEAERLRKLADKAISGVELKLWSEQDGCYIDIQPSHHIGGPYRTLTQDVSLYLVAITEDLGDNNSLKAYRRKGKEIKREERDKESDDSSKRRTSVNRNIRDRSLSTLDAIKSRLWKDKWPLITEVELKSTGPWVLKPNFYHNHTFWPWATGIEMLARSRFDRFEECAILLSKLASEDHPHTHAFYEWINPITDKVHGAYPFRTGVSAVRIAIADILWKQNHMGSLYEKA